MLNSDISKAHGTEALLLVATTNLTSLNQIHAANVWNKLGRQHDVQQVRHRAQMLQLLGRTRFQSVLQQQHVGSRDADAHATHARW